MFLCPRLYTSAPVPALVVVFSVRGSPLPCGFSVHFSAPLRNPLLLTIRVFVRGVPLPHIGPFVGGRPVLAAVGGRPIFALVFCKVLTPHCMGEPSGSRGHSSRWLEARCGCLVSLFVCCCRPVDSLESGISKAKTSSKRESMVLETMIR